VFFTVGYCIPWLLPYSEPQYLSVAARYTVGGSLSNTQHWHETVYTSCDLLEVKLRVSSYHEW